MADDTSPAKDFSAYIEKLEQRIALLEKQQQPATGVAFGFQPMSAPDPIMPLEPGFVPSKVLLYVPGQFKLEWRPTKTGFQIVDAGLRNTSVMWIAWR